MSDTPTRFPLAWPMGRPRTKFRKAGSFNYKGETNEHGWRPTKNITIAVAMDRLERELQALGGRNALLSSNVDTRLDGRPRSGAPEPSDPGVVLYFTLDGKPMSMPCDAYTTVAQNIAALAAHIQATRAIARHGVATGAETLQAFQALPSPDHVLPARKPWRHVLGFPDSWPGNTVSGIVDTINRHYRAEAIKTNGNEAALSDLNIARDAALKEFS